MKKEKNPVWSFLASVKLALFTLIILAVTSIIGTIIPQGEPMSFYIQNFGAGTAKIFQLLNIPDMYNAWWFLSLLVLFSLNLIVCSLERIPNVWRIITANNLETDVDRLAKMRNRYTFTADGDQGSVLGKMKQLMASSGWKTDQADKNGGTLLFSQKGAWTRLGVYTVHGSILVIFIGAIIGSVYGYKASVMLPEGSTTKEIYKSNETHTPVPLGFELRCDSFSLTYYDSGAPKEFRSNLAVLQNGKEVLQKSIVVNDPLDYGGLTFYQSSYQEMQGQFVAAVTNKTTGANQKFIIQPRREQKWNEEGVTFGIVNLTGPDWRGNYQYKIWFNDKSGKPTQFTINENDTVNLEREGTTYSFSLKKRFATGLQVAKDPGVWWVYIGCIVMILGLIVVFFLSHKRVWVFVGEENGKTKILLCGQSNKNKFAFEKDMESLAASFQEDGSLQAS